MFNFLNGPHVVPNGIYDPIIINSGKKIQNHIKPVHVEFHGGNKIFKLLIIFKHIFLRVLIWEGPTITKFGNLV